MRKLLYVTLALFITSAISWGTPCSPNLNLAGLVSLGAGGCTVSGNTVASVSSNLTAQGAIDITSITSGVGSGGFTAGPITLSANSSNTFNFTLSPAAGFSITDLSAALTGGTGGTLALTLSNGASISNATTGIAGVGGATGSATFAGVSSLGVTGTLSGSATASGSTTIAITPSLSPVTTSAVPEPATLGLFATGLGVLILLGLRTRLKSRMV